MRFGSDTGPGPVGPSQVSHGGPAPAVRSPGPTQVPVDSSWSSDETTRFGVSEILAKS